MNDLLKKAYIEAVIKHLPTDQKEDIKKELSTIIDDLIESDDKSLEKALLYLGKPKSLAMNYLEQKDYVIGPKYKSLYFQTLKFVIPLIWTIILVLNLVSLLFTGYFNFDSIFSGAFNSTFIVFTYITLGFMIAEKVNGVKNDNQSWHPNDLNLDKYELKKWPKSNSYVGIIALLVIMILFNRYAHLIGINIIGSSDQVVFINQANYHQFLPWINLGIMLLLTRLFLRLFFSYYTKLSCIISISLHGIASIILLAVFFNVNFLNPNLTSELQSLNFPEFINFDFIHNIFILIGIVTIIVFIIDTFQEVRYGLFKK
ncbi:MAG TPA: hypothetical protein VJ878_00920 [Candidatus Izemoplasmatales bacterium]|nr:hypothetical protein [Candidatus Izemoplasmatales bacterium]